MDQKLATVMHDARLVAACDNVIYPLLDKRITDRLNVACGKFRKGDKDFLTDIAYITGLQDIAVELKQLQTIGNKAIEKLQGQN